MYYNTTNETGETLKIHQAKANKQGELILAFFKKNPGFWAAHEVHQRLFSSATPLTSTRAVITTLTKDGELIKTGVKVPGIYGRDVYTWKKA